MRREILGTVLRKKSEIPKEVPEEKPRKDEAVEPERLLSLQDIDLTASKPEEKNEALEPKRIREYIPEKFSRDSAAMEGDKTFAQKKFTSSKNAGQGGANLGGTIRYKKHKTNLARLYR